MCCNEPKRILQPGVLGWPNTSDSSPRLSSLRGEGSLRRGGGGGGGEQKAAAHMLSPDVLTNILSSMLPRLTSDRNKEHGLPLKTHATHGGSMRYRQWGSRVTCIVHSNCLHMYMYLRATRGA